MGMAAVVVPFCAAASTTTLALSLSGNVVPGYAALAVQWKVAIAAGAGLLGFAIAWYVGGGVYMGGGGVCEKCTSSAVCVKMVKVVCLYEKTSLVCIAVCGVPFSSLTSSPHHLHIPCIQFVYTTCISQEIWAPAPTQADKPMDGGCVCVCGGAVLVGGARL